MAIYAIGDIQGCFDELIALSKKISFDPNKDKLWFVGDLVNRGPKSLETLRWVKSLGDSAITVLGNHDLHLLAAFAGIRPVKKLNSLSSILQAKDAADLIDWLRKRPIFHYDAKLDIAMVHAGLVPQWSILDAQIRALEVEAILSSDNYAELLQHMYGDKPNYWRNSLAGWERLRMITNIFTRMRYCDKHGVMDFIKKGPPDAEKVLQPWFKNKSRNSRDTKIVFGHWSTLGYQNKYNVIATDTGCLWGGALTAVRIDSKTTHIQQIQCKAKREPPAKI